MSKKSLTLAGALTPLLILAGCFYLILLRYFSNFKQTALEIGIPQDHLFHQFLGNQQNDLIFWFLICLVLTLGIAVGMGILIYQKLEKASV